MTFQDPTAFDLGGVGSWTDPRERRLTGWTAHGNHKLDVPFMTEVAPYLWHGGVQQGLVLPTFIKHVLSLYQWEEYTVNHELLSSKTVEMYDSLDQSLDQIAELAVGVNEARKTGPVLVHCQAGLNRSSLVVAKALLLSGEVANGQEAIDLIRTRRSVACLCNPAFEYWVATQ